MKDFGNAQVAALPARLRAYVVEQHYEHYTPIDHAVWRYVMRQNYHYLKDVAYYPYIPGLKAAGLSIEKIPSLQEMNDALGLIGWGAVTVDGFIPPAVFMEFQARNVLVVAAEIRSLAHVAYTPAPDILHESAGHAPIIAEPLYREYLQYFGWIGSKAMYSAQDLALYDAIRALSIIKEMQSASTQAVAEAEALVLDRQNNMGEPSEMALLSRLHWWTVEYGLIGTPDTPKIYGAGLLSSIGESMSCMQPDVPKLWYTKDAVNYPYDITRPQPQLFVTPDFQNLMDVLEDFAGTMAFRTGGVRGLQKAIGAKKNCTAVFDSGLQVTGTFVAYREREGKPCYLQTAGPTMLAYHYELLPGQGKERHPDGLGCPIGPLAGSTIRLADMSFKSGSYKVFRFKSGIVVMGLIDQVLQREGANLLISISHCTVVDPSGDILFDPSWGIYDLAVGEEIISVFNSPGDQQEQVLRQKKARKKSSRLEHLYGRVRQIREKKPGRAGLAAIWLELRSSYPDDWLCALEILELLDAESVPWADDLRQYLEHKAGTDADNGQLISEGLKLNKFLNSA